MKFLLNLVRKDFKKNKVMTLSLAVFLTLSALMLAGGLRITGTLISSLNGLNDIAVPPQYLQMHKGSYDEDALSKFVEDHKYIKEAQAVKMLNVNNADFFYQEESFEKSLMDNGFIIQNEKFDFLLNLNNELAVVGPGEIGVPVYFSEVLGIKEGDVLRLHKGDYNKELVVTTIIRDASMNSALASSKRFLIHPSDMEAIALHMGEWEYMFEFLIEEGASTALLGKDYMEEGMPANGVAITGSLLTMMNGVSHGLVAFIILAISMLLILMAMVCLSYIIRATLADETSTIGEMKAIGFPGKAIHQLYQTKYVLLGIMAGFIGYIGAIPLGDFFSSSVVLYSGYGHDVWLKWVLPLVGTLILILMVMRRCRRILRKNLKNTTIELMRGDDNKKNEGHYTLPSMGLKWPNMQIALGELKCKWKTYIVIFFVFVFTAFLILLPMNMKNTIENPSFITYMGIGQCDVRIDIQYSEGLEQQKDHIISYLDKDVDIEKYAVHRTNFIQVKNDENQWEYIRVEKGDPTVFPLAYLEGNPPKDGQTIALSYLNASELGKTVNDNIEVKYQGEVLTFTISGIYQDITYGGKTAKTSFDFNENNVEAYNIFLDLRDGVDIDEKTDVLRSILKESKITPIHAFVAQTLGGISENMALVETAAIVIALLLMMLITVMFLQLMIAREHGAIAIKKAIGFRNKDIRLQFGIRIILVQLMGIVIGTVLARSLGEDIFGLLLSFMGASKITMLVEPVSAYVFWPAVQITLVMVTIIGATKAVQKYHIRNQVIE
ncbi:MAG: ABC transporter permease [Firmicutes bacterium HGW-Firmicutes-2]|jgi:putative ABC transport system permease protein|nr:MAG: ABC transporter permease [Firmicutes bacterium HGW-Firmicutes-2]